MVIKDSFGPYGVPFRGAEPPAGGLRASAIILYDPFIKISS